MLFLPTTHEFLALVERETGYPVKLLEDPNLPSLAKVHMACGNGPGYSVICGRTHDESLDYMNRLQCRRRSALPLGRLRARLAAWPHLAPLAATIPSPTRTPPWFSALAAPAAKPAPAA